MKRDLRLGQLLFFVLCQIFLYNILTNNSMVVGMALQQQQFRYMVLVSRRKPIIIAKTKPLCAFLLHFVPSQLFYWRRKHSPCWGWKCEWCVNQNDGHVNFLCRRSCSSFMRAKFMASLSVLGLNIWIAFEISNFSPPINIPIKAIYVHPWTWLPSLLNSFW